MWQKEVIALKKQQHRCKFATEKSALPQDAASLTQIKFSDLRFLINRILHLNSRADIQNKRPQSGESAFGSKEITLSLSGKTIFFYFYWLCRTLFLWHFQWEVCVGYPSWLGHCFRKKKERCYCWIFQSNLWMCWCPQRKFHSSVLYAGGSRQIGDGYLETSAHKPRTSEFAWQDSTRDILCCLLMERSYCFFPHMSRDTKSEQTAASAHKLEYLFQPKPSPRRKDYMKCTKITIRFQSDMFRNSLASLIDPSHASVFQKEKCRAKTTKEITIKR